MPDFCYFIVYKYVRGTCTLVMTFEYSQWADCDLTLIIDGFSPDIYFCIDLLGMVILFTTLFPNLYCCAKLLRPTTELILLSSC